MNSVIRSHQRTDDSKVISKPKKTERIEARVKRRFEQNGWTTFITGLPDVWAFRRKIR